MVNKGHCWSLPGCFRMIVLQVEWNSQNKWPRKRAGEEIGQPDGPVCSLGPPGLSLDSLDQECISFPILNQWIICNSRCDWQPSNHQVFLRWVRIRTWLLRNADLGAGSRLSRATRAADVSRCQNSMSEPCSVPSMQSKWFLDSYKLEAESH